MFVLCICYFSIVIPYAQAKTQARKIFCSVVFNPVSQAQSAHVQAVLHFKKALETYSKGSLQVKIAWNNTLAPNFEAAQQALMQNRVHFVQIPSSALSAYSSAVLPLNVFFLFPYPDLTLPRALVGGSGGDIIRSRMLRETGLRIEAFWELGYRHLLSEEDSGNSLANFQGKNWRMTPNPVHEEGFKLLGMKPVPMPWENLYEALRNKRISGTDNTLADVEEGRLYEMQKHLLLTGHAFEFSCVLTSQRFYNSLSPAERKSWDTAIAESTAVYRKVFTKNTAGVEERLAKHIKIQTISLVEKAAFIRVVQPTRLLAAQMAGEEYYRAIMAELEKLRAKTP